MLTPLGKAYGESQKITSIGHLCQSEESTRTFAGTWLVESRCVAVAGCLWTTVPSTALAVRSRPQQLRADGGSCSSQHTSTQPHYPSLRLNATTQGAYAL